MRGGSKQLATAALVTIAVAAAFGPSASAQELSPELVELLDSGSQSRVYVDVEFAADLSREDIALLGAGGVEVYVQLDGRTVSRFIARECTQPTGRDAQDQEGAPRQR